MKTLPWMVTGVASIVACVGVFSACSSDTSSLPAAQEAGAGGSKSTGGRSSSSGGSSTAGASGASGAANSCTVAVSTTCDGKEDCPAGQRCCGTLSIGGGATGMGTGTTGYTKFGCYDTCALPEAGSGDAGGGLGGFGGPLLVEICNPADGCENGVTCQTSSYLPGTLARCLPAMLGGMAMSGTPDTSLTHKAKEINCGTKVCGANEQCCIREPALDAYCAPKTATCGCTPPDAGSGDSGGGGGKGGQGGAAGSAGKAGAAGSAGKGGTAPTDSGTD